MKPGIGLLLLCILSIPAFAWQTLPLDTVPGKKEYVPSFNINLPHKDTTATPKNLLAFPFAVRSLETSWGFGGIVARFFKAEKHDTSIRTSDVNIPLQRLLRPTPRSLLRQKDLP